MTAILGRSLLLNFKAFSVIALVHMLSTWIPRTLCAYDHKDARGGIGLIWGMQLVPRPCDPDLD